MCPATNTLRKTFERGVPRRRMEEFTELFQPWYRNVEGYVNYKTEQMRMILASGTRESLQTWNRMNGQRMDDQKIKLEIDRLRVRSNKN